MTSLSYFPLKLDRRLSILDNAHRRLSLRRHRIRKIDRFSAQMGLVSTLWQVWNDASRSIILSSVKGAILASGAEVSSEFSGFSTGQIRFAAMKFARNEQVDQLKEIAGDHVEPTWGDLDKASRIVSRFRPTNSSQLLSAFGSMNLVKDLQITRNACAHISIARLQEIYELGVRYDGDKPLHPSDVIYLIDPNTKDFSWYSWTDEIRAFACYAVE